MGYFITNHYDIMVKKITWLETTHWPFSFGQMERYWDAGKGALCVESTSQSILPIRM